MVVRNGAQDQRDMTRRGRPTLASLPKRTRAILDDVAQRTTIRSMLANGAIATPIGPVTHLRLPGRQDSATFPTEVVDDVERAIAERLRNSAEAKA